MEKEEILNDLTQKIFSEHYLPGAYLTERDLCDSYGISRTPMREILWGLESRGLVTQQKGKGFSVRQMDWKQLCEVFETREGVEGLAARLCCLKLSEPFSGRFRDLRSRIEQLEVERNSALAVRCGRELHHLIVETTDNSLIFELYEKLDNLATLISNMTRRVENIETESRKHHLQIIDAILEGDEALSEHTMREHIRITFHQLLRSLYPGSMSISGRSLSSKEMV